MEGRFKNEEEAKEFFKNNPLPKILNDMSRATILNADLVELVQTEEDIAFSLSHNVRRFTHLKLNGNLITDKDEISKIMNNS